MLLIPPASAASRGEVPLFFQRIDGGSVYVNSFAYMRPGSLVQSRQQQIFLPPRTPEQFRTQLVAARAGRYIVGRFHHWLGWLVVKLWYSCRNIFSFCSGCVWRAPVRTSCVRPAPLPPRPTRPGQDLRKRTQEKVVSLQTDLVGCTTSESEVPAQAGVPM